MEIRTATQIDAPHLMRVFELASEGLAPYLWAQKAGPGGDARAVGLESMTRKLTEAAPNTTLMAEVDGQVAGGIITFSIGAVPEDIPAACDPMILPLIKLENIALNTHYVNALAVFPEFQGQGIGTKLLRQVLANAGPCGMSLIAEDHNIGARRLYEREGYLPIATAPVVAGGWKTQANNFILMMRDVKST